jgi:hypothetical protein
VANFDGQQIITVAFNDATDTYDTIQQTEDTRRVFAGASYAGWSYSTDRGKTWTYGGKLTPEAGWPILWSDPAITVSRADARNVYMSWLAVPIEKYPPGGILNSRHGPVYGMELYLGGACIAEFSDGGVTFHLSQCLTNDHQLYDGGHMAAGNNGEVYVAYITDDNNIDVWGKAGAAAPFARLPAPPFLPGTAVTHPRIRVDPIFNRLYLAAQLGSSSPQLDYAVFLTYWDPLTGLWSSPVAATAPASGPLTMFLATDRWLRTAMQFSFDVGQTSGMTGEDNIRFLYVKADPTNPRHYLYGSYCNLQLACHPAPQWGTGPLFPGIRGHQFNPNVSAAPYGSGSSIWKASYLSREDDPSGYTVSVKQGNLAVLPGGQRVFLPTTAVPSHEVCADDRGYWGDYDDLQYIGESPEGAHEFIRAYSDSSLGCNRQWQFTSWHVHVSSVVF